MSAIRHVAIIGAGLAGLACACAAAQAGLTVEVFSNRPLNTAEVLHLDATPNLIRGLDRLGCLSPCQCLGFAYSRTRTMDAQGHTLDASSLPRLAGDSKPAGLGLLQGDLLQVLLAQAVQHGAKFHAGMPVAGIDAEQGLVRLADASAVQVDLILLAAGVRSPLRQAVFPQAAPAVPYAQQWWHVVLPRVPGLDQPTWALGPRGQKLQAVPIAPTKAGLTFCWANAPAHGASSRAQQLRAALRNFPSCPAAWQEALHEEPPVVARPVREALLPGPWHRGRVLAVGDCAHALAPHFGQGPAQAVEDAVVLRELLAELLRQDLPLAEWMTRYTARRMARLEPIHALTSRAALWDQNPSPATNLHALAQEFARVAAEPA